MKNCVSINLKTDKIVIKIAENAEQKEIIQVLRKKLPELKKMYQDEKIMEKYKKMKKSACIFRKAII